MSEAELPPGWAMVAMADVTEPVAKTDPTRWVNDDELVYYDIGGIDNRAHRIQTHQVIKAQTAPSRARQEVRQGDVLFSSVRTYLENIAIVPACPEPALRTLASTGVCVLRASEGVDPRFLFYRCLAPDLLETMKTLQQGTSYPAIRDDDLKRFRFALPPTPEQVRIADEIERRLSHVEAAERSLREALRKIQKAGASLAEAAINGAIGSSVQPPEIAEIEAQRLVSVASGHSTRAKWRVTPAASVGPPPGGMVVVPLGRIALDADYGTSKKCGANADGTAVIRIPNIRHRSFDMTDLKYLPASEVSPDQLLAAGDVLFIRSNGSTSLIGVAAAVTVAATGKTFASYLIRFRLGPDPILARWVELVALAPSRRRWLVEQASSSAGQNNLSQSDIAAMPIPIAARVDLERILDEYERRQSLLEAAQRSIVEQITRCATLRASILAAAFTGRLVPHDPADEPAEHLVQHIRDGGASNVGRARRGSRRRTAMEGVAS